MKKQINIKNQILKLCLAISLIAVGMKYAEAADDSSVYVNLNAGVGSGLTVPELGFLPDVGAGAISINAGYNFNKYFALEGGITSYSGGLFSVGTSARYFDIAAKGSLPFGDIFALYGRAGLAYQNITENVFSDDSYANNLTVMVGIGTAFKLTKTFEIHLEDTYFPQISQPINYSNVNILSLGLQVNF